MGKAKSPSNYEIAKKALWMDEKSREEYYNGFLIDAKQNFKRYCTLILWALFCVVVALICMIPVGRYDIFGNKLPNGVEVPPGFIGVSPFSAIVCIILSVLCSFTAIYFKFKDKVKVVIFFVLSIAVLCFISFFNSTENGRIQVVKNIAWVILFVFDVIALILMLRKAKFLRKNAGATDSERNARIYHVFAAVFVLNPTLTFSAVHSGIIDNFDQMPVPSFALLISALVLFTLSIFPSGLNAFKAANACKAIKGKRLDGTKKIFWCTLFPVINAYSTLIVIWLSFHLILTIMAGIVSANNPKSTVRFEQTVERTVYSDGQHSFYIEDEKIYDEQNRQTGRVINGKVYDNEMNQIGYINGDKILPL